MASIKTKVTTDSPLKTIKEIPEFEKPIVEVSINNPFKRILYWLDQIRRHQTTTFAVKLSIPLIALPIVIAAAFTLGRYVLPFQKSTSISNPSTIPASSPLPALLTTISRAGTLKIASGVQTHYLLSLSNGAIVNLQIPQNINLTKYQNKQVLVTGTLDKTTGTLNVTDIAEIQIFNSTSIPATQSATLQSTPSAN